MAGGNEGIVLHPLSNHAIVRNCKKQSLKTFAGIVKREYRGVEDDLLRYQRSYLFDMDLIKELIRDGGKFPEII